MLIVLSAKPADTRISEQNTNDDTLILEANAAGEADILPEESVENPADNSQAVEGEIAEEHVKSYVYLGRYYITGYDICKKCCGKTDGITASGARASVGRTIAAPKNIPFGTVLYIEGIGERVVEDRGGSVKNKRLDVLCRNHKECYAVTGWYDVYEVVE